MKISSISTVHRADAPDLGQPFDDRLVLHAVERPPARDPPCRRLRREIAHREDLRTRQARSTQRVVVEREQPPGARPAAGEQSEEAAMDGARRLAGELLVDDGAQQRRERRLRRPEARGLARPDHLDDPIERAVAPSQMREGAVPFVGGVHEALLPHGARAGSRARADGRAVPASGEVPASLATASAPGRAPVRGRLSGDPRRLRRSAGSERTNPGCPADVLPGLADFRRTSRLIRPPACARSPARAARCGAPFRWWSSAARR